MTASWKRLFSILLPAFVAAQVSSNAFGQSVSSTVVSTPTSDIEVSGSYDLSYGFKPQYFENSGEYVEQVLGLQLKPTEDWSIRLLAFVYSEWEDERKTGPGDTFVRLTRANLVKAGPYSLTARVTGKLPTSEDARDAGLRGRTSSRITNRLTFGPFSAYHHLYGQKYYYEETLNAEGASNRDYEVKNTVGASVAYAKFTLALTGSVTNRFMHQGERKDLQESTADIAYDLTEKVSASAGILTSQAQIEDGRRNTASLYEKDITEAYSGLSFLF